jgi:hypothetical protein
MPYGCKSLFYTMNIVFCESLLFYTNSMAEEDKDVKKALWEDVESSWAQLQEGALFACMVHRCGWLHAWMVLISLCGAETQLIVSPTISLVTVFMSRLVHHYCFHHYSP